MSRTIADVLLRPRSVAVVGASTDPAKLSGRPLDYLLRFGYRGSVYAVNPHRSTVQGIAAYPTVAAVPDHVELAVVVVPATGVPAALRDCAAAGVSAAIVFASGFAETGRHELQREVDEIVRTSSLRLLGPNCLGTFAANENVFATFSSAFDDATSQRPDGPIAYASQSGAVGTFTYSAMAEAGVGVRYFVNTGNEVDVTVAEVLGHLAGFPDVRVLLGYLEGMGDPDQLAAAADAAAANGKPLVLLKSGRSAAGARAAAAHTASDAGDDAEFDAIAREHGIVRVDGMEPLIDAAIAFRPGRRAGGHRLSIVTLSGGAAVLATDTAVDIGLRVDEWSPQAQAAMGRILPAFGSSANPIDVTGALLTDPDLLDRTLAYTTSHAETDVVAVVLGNADRGSDVIVDGVRRAYERTDKPFVVVWTGGSGRPRRWLLDAGIPTYTDPARAVRALRHVVEHSRSVTGRGLATAGA